MTRRHADGLTGAATDRSVVPDAAASNLHFARKYAFIDAARGYAVLMVIASHVGDAFSALPYPVKKLVDFGWHGVQLFFLVSCLTLLLSWRSDEAKGQVSLPAFWARRLFRIAPMYYLGAALYAVIEPPPGGFDPVHLLATLAFVNVWHPYLVPTVPGWMVVPGGWSIGVEVTFYVLFPAIAAWVRSMRAALLFLAAALAIGCIANPLMMVWLHGCCGRQAIRNFIYFWFPNQLPVFALGTVLYHAIRATWDQPAGRAATLLRRHATAIVATCAAACVALANLPFPESLPFAPPLFVPTLLVASAVFMVAVLALGNARRSPFLNRAICALGQVSFSAYVLHFAVIHQLTRRLPSVFDVHATGWHAILCCAALGAAVLPVTWGLSTVTFRLVEAPMIARGRALLAGGRRVSHKAESAG